MKTNSLKPVEQSGTAERLALGELKLPVTFCNGGKKSNCFTYQHVSVLDHQIHIWLTRIKITSVPNFSALFFVLFILFI